jgi:serine/threonine protein kinase/Tol biopolymer transport system component
MIGQMISHYKILEKLGEGGMGVVYKAQDTKLDRMVALKFLPERLSNSEQDRARFLQEAKAASALNHPNICTIHGIEEHNGQMFIVMELVEGQTLREKKSSTSYKQALDIGIQLAEGLAAAHEKGVVHRDIKPDNIMIRKDGIAQIMDFGLAKLRGVSRLTKEGSTVGTAGYMSPEQVQGLDADHRSDIFSLGVVLYELLTGQLPFLGVHEAALMYQIVNVEASPLSIVKEGIAPDLDAIILECLEKDKEERCQSAKELARNLRKLKRSSSGSKASKVFKVQSFTKEPGAEKNETGSRDSKLARLISENKMTAAIISCLTIAVVLLAALQVERSSASGFTQPVHFSFDIPGQSSQILNWEYVLQISPDGNAIAYADLSQSPSVIEIRNLSSNDPYPVRGTEGAIDPVFENDNWISFTVKRLEEKVPIAGGVPDISGTSSINGFSWGVNGEMVFAKGWPSGLTFQSAWNGKEEELTTIDPSKNEGTHMLPYILPGDNAAVFTIWSKEGTFDDSKISVVNLKTKERKNLSYNGVELQGTSPRCIETPWGDYLVWSRSGNLYASSFDLSSLQVKGPETKILEGVAVNASSGKAAYSVSSTNNGTIAYMPGKLDTAKNYLMWVDKNGTEKKALTKSGPYLMPMVSMDGRAIVVLTGPVYKIGLINFKENNVDLLFGSGDNNIPKITPDGAHFVFVSNFEDGKYNVYMSRLDGIGGVKKIVATEGGYAEISNLSPEGKYILYSPDLYADSANIWIKDIRNDQQPKLLFNSKTQCLSPAFSPDGKWIAYRSNEIGGKFKLFIQPFPINDSKIQVSVNDGLYPQWSADGTELYYRDNDQIMAARIQTKAELKLLSTRLVCTSTRVSLSTGQPDFTVAPDGRVLLVKNAEDVSKPVKVNVIVNWFAELRKKLANKLP